MADYKSRSALDWLQSAAESGIADAQYELGRNLIHGNQQFRAQVERLRQEYIRQREQEIEKIKRKAADGRQSSK